MEVSSSDLFIGRVLHEDESFVTIEVAKNNDVSFHLQQNEEGETVGGDRFLTMLFLKNFGVWNPFK